MGFPPGSNFVALDQPEASIGLVLLGGRQRLGPREQLARFRLRARRLRQQQERMRQIAGRNFDPSMFDPMPGVERSMHVVKPYKLVARECQVFMDTGAYADAGPRVTQKAGYRALGPYKVPHAKVEAHGVYTNTVPAGAFRGFGALQVTWAYESQMDMIAARLGLDPLELRLKNLLKKGDLYTAGDTPVDCDLKEGLLKVADAINEAPPGRIISGSEEQVRDLFAANAVQSVPTI